MKNKTLFLISFLLFIFSSCGSNEEEQQAITSENDIDAARNFIQSSLNGEYKKARNYMLKDSANMQYFDFKYLFQHSADTLETNVSLNTDSLPWYNF